MKSILRRKQKNLLTVFSVTLAVALLVGVGAASNGIYGAFSDSWWGLNADTDITIEDPSSTYFPSNITDIISNSADPNLSTLNGITQSIETYSNVLYSAGKIDAKVSMYAIETDDPQFGQYYDMKGKVIDINSTLNSQGMPQVIINNELAISLDLKIGDTFQTTIDNGQGEPVPMTVKVADIFDAKLGRGREFVFRPASRYVINIAQVQQKMIDGMKDHINVIRLSFKQISEGGVLSRNINDLDINKQTFPGKEMLENAVDTLKEMLSERLPTAIVRSERNVAAENIEENLRGLVGVLNLFVFMLNLTALLLIINVQAMNFDDRSYQTAVLRAMGSSRGQIFRIFLIESSIVRVIGSVFGLLVGLPYADWMQRTINALFEMPGADEAKATLSQSVITGAFTLGVLLSVITAAIPAWAASGNSITEELRGIKSTKTKNVSSRWKIIFFGVLLIIVGILNASNVGEFWKVEVWKNIDNHTPIITSFGLSLSGIGLLVTQFNKRFGLNISAIAILGLAYFDMFWGLTIVEEGDGNNLFTILLLYMIIGSAMLVIVNFEAIMGTINKIFFIFTPLRAVSQVTTKQLIKKKSRATLLFTIFTIILIINVFVSTISVTMTESLVNQYEWRSQGNDILINTQVPSDNITAEIMNIEGVTQVYSFRSAMIPIYYENPNTDNADFDINSDLRFRQVIELREDILNPDGDWGENSYVITVERVDEKLYEKKTGISELELMDLSKTIMKDFFAERKFELESNYTSAETGDIKIEKFDEYMVLGDIFATSGSDIYMQAKGENGSEVVAAKQVTASNDFLGPVDGFGYSLMVTPELANRLEVFDYIKSPNLFLVKTVNGFFDDTENQRIALSIQQKLNNLDDPNSLSSKLGVLVGATSRLIHTEMSALWKQQAGFWDFLATFASIGLLIGAAGMAIIAMRSVSERLREIGMMRAIGFSRNKVVSSVIIEMVFLGLFGLITGVINGILMSYMFARNIFETRMVLPYDILGAYSAIIIGVALISAIIPGVRASRIAPSQALRYTG